MELTVGMELADGLYQLTEFLGEGGMASVWAAERHTPHGPNDEVVLKILLPEFRRVEDKRQMFLAEAHLAQGLYHPNIVTIHEIGRWHNLDYIVMERIWGKDLESLIRRSRDYQQPIPWEIALQLVIPVAEALQYANNRIDSFGQPLTLVHRDIKPANLLYHCSGDVKIIDFGVAKASNSDLRTQTGLVKGTIAYMSPEQLRAEHLDIRSDLFSLTVVLYELLTHRRPFWGETFTSLMLGILTRHPPALDSMRAGLPPALVDFVQRGLDKAAHNRPSDGAAYAGELRHILQQSMQRPSLESYFAHCFPEFMSAWTQRQLYARTQFVPVKELLPSDTRGISSQRFGIASHAGISGAMTLRDDQFREEEYSTQEELPASPAMEFEANISPSTPAVLPTGAIVAPEEVVPTSNKTTSTSLLLYLVVGLLLILGGGGFWWSKRQKRTRTNTLSMRPARKNNTAKPVVVRAMKSVTQRPTTPVPRIRAVPVKPVLLSIPRKPVVTRKRVTRKRVIPRQRTFRSRRLNRVPRPIRRVAMLPRAVHHPRVLRPPVAVRTAQGFPRKAVLRKRRVRQGKVRFRIQPACRLLWNGRELGWSSKAILQTTPGLHRVSCKNRTQRINQIFQVRIKAGATQTFSRRLKKGSVVVFSNHWGKVVLRGFGQIGTTQQVKQLYEGRYTFLIFHGKKQRYKIRHATIKPGQRTVLKVKW